jgi:hypothetical protein
LGGAAADLDAELSAAVDHGGIIAMPAVDRSPYTQAGDLACVTWGDGSRGRLSAFGTFTESCNK